MSGIALQLYTMREPGGQDLAGMLARAREMGWEYVQWSGMPDLPAEEIREALDAAALKAVAAHCAIEPFEKDFEKEARFWKTVGALDVAPGGMMGDCQDSLEAWLRGAKRLDAVGERLREAGMRLSYHNHDREFQTFQGDPRCKLDLLYAETAPNNLYAELDTAWVHVGGADPADYLRKYANRCPVIHVKDYSGKRTPEGHVQFTPLGQGVLDWPDIFAAGNEAGVEWYIYEQDNCVGDLWDEVQLSYEFLKANV